MAEGRSRHDWQLMSGLMALLANCHSSAGGYRPADFDPWTAADAPEADIADLPL
jgi:hypothetical protein